MDIVLEDFSCDDVTCGTPPVGMVEWICGSDARPEILGLSDFT